MRVCDLVVEYGALRVLHGVSFAVTPGELVGIVGRSGCGKTTLLHALAGLLTPTSGVVDLEGAVTAMAFQRPTLLPWRTVLDNAVFGQEAAGAADREGARRLLAEMRLADHLADHPHQLSEGMRQRVNLARALLVDPSVLLLDEPFSALDVRTRRDLHSDLLALQRERGFAVVLVSHTLEEVVELVDRVLVFSEKPTRVRATVEVELPRPRSRDADFFAQVAALEAALSSEST